MIKYVKENQSFWVFFKCNTNCRLLEIFHKEKRDLREDQSFSKASDQL